MNKKRSQFERVTKLAEKWSSKSGIRLFFATQSKAPASLSDVISLIPHKIANYTLLYSRRVENARQSSPRTINNRLRSKVTPISGGGSK